MIGHFNEEMLHAVSLRWERLAGGTRTDGSLARYGDIRIVNVGTLTAWESSSDGKG